ncbi:uncharacterized protein LOC110037641 [Phalaenopsis equestris]|uniref:uncharacterized protein LOC110037641 n=1 Tax=Phalaenopsis equestris TaxID=78828 RepID=UPI0009E471DD|nr:uncharacterized protein LOC110037641 [Phalaenopsis equestris]
MAPCCSLCFDPHKLPKLRSFFQPFCLPFCRGVFSPSPSPLPSDDDGGATDADNYHLNNHHVIILEIRQRAMMKSRSQPRSSFIIVTAEEFGRLINAVAPPPPPSKANKSIDVERREKNDGKYEGEEENEEFFSVKSCFSRCSSGDEDCWLSGRTAALLVTLSEECEGWPFGLWRRRKVVVLPPLPKSPADSWTWHKRNLNNVKV